MWKRRICWFVLIFIAVVLYIFVNGPMALSLLVGACILPFVSMFFLLLVKNKIYINMPEPVTVTKGDRKAERRIEFINSSFLPVSTIDADITCENLRTGEKKEDKVVLDIGGKGRNIIETNVSADHCGRVNLEVSGIIVFDYFGLFGFKGKVSPKKSFCTVIPESHDLRIVLSSSAANMPEGDQYSRSKTGDDPGETLSIKEYVPGDPVKNMHWKLSQKMDKLLIRELGCPIVDQAIIWFDTSFKEGTTPEEMDAAAEIFASLICSMYKNEISPWVGWEDTESGVVHVQRINDESDIDSSLTGAMNLKVRTAEEGLHMRSSQIGRRNNYAHVIVVGVQPDINIADVFNGSMATILMPSQNAGRTGMQKDGTEVVAFDTGNWYEQLEGLEL